VHRSRTPLPVLALAAILLALSSTSGAVEGYQPADPGAPPVTQENLLASERFWPYHVEFPEPWLPPGSETAIRPGTRGVLVRVESPDLARVDFGRHGVHQVPVGKTDLIQRANGVRLGQVDKLAPNFVHAIGPRLMRSTSEQPLPVQFRETFEPPGFLAVFADPGGEGFAELAAALAPLNGRHGVWTVLFPQGGHGDPEVHAQLRSTGWEARYVRDFLTLGYTRSRLREGIPLPAVALETREGRLLFEGAWRPEVAAKLEAALDESFGKTEGETPANAAAEPTPAP
jgi:hypothetical protein